MSKGFVRAVKGESKLRLCVAGPSGSGKTYTSLKFAQHLSKGERFAVIDTENGSASKYADEFGFDVINIEPPFTIDKAVEYLSMAEKAGYAVVVLDSATHFYKGSGGLLEQVDTIAQAQFRGNTYAAWSVAGKIYNKFLEAIKQSRIHVIVTARTKTKYVEGDKKGQMQKVGMEVEMRDGFEYEFDIFAQMTVPENHMFVEKSRCSALQGKSFEKPGHNVVSVLENWLTGARVLDGVVVSDEYAKLKDNTIRFVRSMRSLLGRDGTEEFTKQAVDTLSELVQSPQEVANFISGEALWDQATLEKLNLILSKGTAMLTEALEDIRVNLP